MPRLVTSSSRMKDPSSQVSRVCFLSRTRKMLRLTRVSLSIKRNSKSRSRSMTPSLPLARRVSKVLLKLERNPKSLLSTTMVVRDARVASASPEPLMLLKKPRRTVMMALSKLKEKRDAVAKAREEAVEEEVVVAASTRETTSSMSAEALARTTLRRLRLQLQVLSLQPKRRRSLLRCPFPTRTSRAGVTLLSSEEPISFSIS